MFTNLPSQQPDGQLQKQSNIQSQVTKYIKQDTYETNTNRQTQGYRGANKSLARPTSRCILFDG